MKVTIETTDAELLGKLAALIEIAKNYEGHFNASYTAKNSDYIVMDNMHKNCCLKLLMAKNEDFVIGSGGSHIWVSNATACNVETKENISAHAIYDRLLLITDND